MRIKHRSARLQYAISRMFQSGITTPNFDLIYDNENELTVCIEDLLEDEWEPNPQVQKEVQVVELKSEEWPDEEQGSWLGRMADYAEIYNYNRQMLHDTHKKRVNRENQKRHYMKVKEGQKIKKVEGKILQKKVKVDFFEYDKEPSHILVRDLKTLLDDSPDDGVLQISLTGPKGFYNLHFDNIRVIIPNSHPLEAVRLMPVDNK